jgi:FMN-dependent NADH-azoreductase
MRHLLQINTSLFGEGGQSTTLANEFVRAWQETHPQGIVIQRNASGDAIPHLTGERFTAFLAKPEARTPEQQAFAGFSESLIEELRRADTIVLGLPLYNFGVPSSLKAYFDHIARAGITFRYTENGPQGLLTGKKVYVFATRGGQYAGTPLDSQTNFVRDFLAFLGMKDVEFIYAEGLAMGDASKTASLAKAREVIEGIRNASREQPYAVNLAVAA